MSLAAGVGGLPGLKYIPGTLSLPVLTQRLTVASDGALSLAVSLRFPMDFQMNLIYESATISFLCLFLMTLILVYPNSQEKK